MTAYGRDRDRPTVLRHMLLLFDIIASCWQWRSQEVVISNAIAHGLQFQSTLSAATCKNGKGSPYSIADRRIPELIPVLGSWWDVIGCNSFASLMLTIAETHKKRLFHRAQTTEIK